MRIWLAAVLLAGLASPTDCRKYARRALILTQEQVVDIAKKELEKHGHSVAQYDVTVVKDEPSRDHWMVWFEYRAKYKIPGGKHGVRVDKSTGKAVFLPGE